ncbi:MFS transporter [Alicyclobacillus acidoterrestris]|uniref:MFS transporter n=1 Tax=Alicyclobacillus suci TaxID=2816080 RepID=UPI001191FB9E|nr:MFS transporter [Alicyclobacillus suci]GEO25341.1 MFS transporter [Alicyclobacillus acidoterrestris]
MSGILSTQVEREHGRPLTNIRWLHIVPALVVLQTIGMIDKVNVGIVMHDQPFQVAMNIVGKHGLAGLLTTLFAVAYGVGMPVWGFLSDRFGPRRIAIYACIVWVVMLLLGGISTNLGVLYVSRIGLGLAEAAIWPVCNNLTARWFPVKERSRASAVWVSGINLGVAAAGLLVPALLSTLGWRSVFFVLAAAGLIPIVLLITLVRDEPQSSRASLLEIERIQSGILQETNEVPRAQNFARTNVFKNYRFWFLALANTATGMGIFGINTWLPSYLTDVRHMSLSGMGDFTAAAWFLGIGMLLWLSRWSDRLVRRAPFGIVFFLIYAVLIFFSTEVQNTILVLIMIGIAIWVLQGTTVVIHSLIHSFSRETQMGKAGGVLSGVSNFIGAFASYIMGLLLGPNNNYSASFGFLAAVAILSAAAMAVLTPQKY